MSLRRAQLCIKGKVQGVFFRESAKKCALELGVTGWVRNDSAGHVEVVAEAPPEALEDFIKWCRKGPPAASVLFVEVKEFPPTGEFSTFFVLR